MPKQNLNQLFREMYGLLTFIRLGGHEPDLERAHSVTVDPQRDDAKTLVAYAKRFGAGPGWHFVREEPARLAPVLAAYDEWTRREGSGELDHPARLHLIDAAGRVREIYSLAFFDEEQAFLDIKALHKQALSR